MTHTTPLAEIVRLCRVRAGLTIEELSEASGVSVRAISNIERGVSRIPQRRNLDAVADATGADDTERAELAAALRTLRRYASGFDDRRGCGPEAARERFAGRVEELSSMRVAMEVRGRGDAVVVVLVGDPRAGAPVSVVTGGQALGDRDV